MKALREALHRAKPQQESECWYRIGRNYLRRELAKEAEQAFAKAPDHFPSMYQLAKLMVRSERAQPARDLLEKLRERYPRSIKINALSAQADEALGNDQNAKKFRDLIERSSSELVLDSVFDMLEPTRDLYGAGRRFRAAQRLFESGNPSGAQEKLNEAIELDWREEFVMAAAGIAVQTGDRAADDNEKQGQADRAIELIEGQIARTGAVPKQLEPLGAALWLKGDRDEAAAQWQRSAAMRPTANVHAKLASYYQVQGDEESARSHRSRANQIAGTEAFRGDRLAEAATLLQTAVQLDPENAAAWYYLGEVLRTRNKKKEAIEAYQRCLQLDPEHGRAHLGVERVAAAEN